MATASMRIDPGEPRRVDGLCPTCFLPSLWTVDMNVLSAAGVSTVATATNCQTGCPPVVVKNSPDKSRG